MNTKQLIIQKKRKNCGQVAVHNLIYQLGEIPPSLKSIEDGTFFNKKEGTLIQDINSYLCDLGFDSRIIKTNNINSIKRIQKTHEMIILFHFKKPKKCNHFVTLLRFTKEGFFVTNNSKSHKYRDSKKIYWMKNTSSDLIYKIIAVKRS